MRWMCRLMPGRTAPHAADGAPPAPPEIVIGVTGHRDLGKRAPAVEAVLRERCRALKKRYPGHRFAVLSALAEGADRLAARVAMEELGARLIVALPVPRENYETDFENSRAEFSHLFGQASQVVEDASLAAGRAWAFPGEARNRRYAWAGTYVADHAHVLFAIWDGKPARGTGGTAEVVHHFRRRLEPAPDGLSCAVPLPGAGGNGMAEGLGEAAPLLLVHITPETLAVRETPAWP